MKTVPDTTSSTQELAVAWQSVDLSRHPSRPYTLDYLDKAFSTWTEICGDRLFQEDKALIAGLGKLRPSDSLPKGQSVVFVGHQKGRKTKEKIDRNFGMPHPEGYRKAQRAYKIAERFDLPVITLVDTPGAYPGVAAEERGQSEAIASSILTLLNVATPTISIVIGEGGSGGALALACADIVIMFRNSTYSVISPESCAAILWSDSAKAKEAAAALKSGAENLLELGLCDEILATDFSSAQTDPNVVAEKMIKDFHETLSKQLKKLMKMNSTARMQKRYERYRNFDAKFLKGLRG